VLAVGEVQVAALAVLVAAVVEVQQLVVVALTGLLTLVVEVEVHLHTLITLGTVVQE
jgi:hypothetical protein